MTLRISHVESADEFEELVRVQYAALSEPMCPFRDLFFPIENDSDEARQEALKDGTQRQISEFKGLPPGVKWIKAVDTGSGKLLGAAMWCIFHEDPYKGAAADEVAEWFPEGEERDLASDLMRQISTPRRRWMRKPHVFLDMMFTDPQARRRGVGRILMDWGIQEADKRGYDTYLDATLSGRDLYKNYGFVEGEQREWTLSHFENTAQRQESEAKYLPMIWWPMYRPAVTDVKEVDRMPPWEGNPIPCGVTA